ncbi:MAG: type II toxin-antitoxin system RelE/ParE family toxin [Candidatus Electryonea clarkiae]|nr:type II toxin-antitoxin system RelE/ParE family toxin [Candidatus Electryonea clarkiae]MDP8285960.1 type II toxin-antitoxin system RelE/ParE family toxin [Candidatus Electryonea clarkiae]
MSYRLLYERRFVGDLEIVPVSEQAGIERRLKWLSENVLIISHSPLKGKRFEGVFKIRISRWRIFCRLDHKQETIYVLSIKDRKDAYR